MWIKSNILSVALLALFCVLLFSFPSALGANELSTLTPSGLSERLERALSQRVTISNSIDLTLQERLTLMVELSSELPALREDLETLKADSENSLMLMNALDVKLTNLEITVKNWVTSLSNIEEDMKRAKNRATWAMAGTIILGVIVLGGGAYLAYRVNK